MMEDEIPKQFDSLAKKHINGSYKKVLQNSLVSVFSTLFILCIVGLFLWFNRMPIVKKLVSEYRATQPKAVIAPEPVIQEVIKEKEAPVVIEKVDTVISAVSKAKPAVVSIIVLKDGQNVGSGSGFLISNDGYIVTNKHVVRRDDVVYDVQLNNNKKYEATVLARDSVLDVAIIKINVKNLPFLVLADSSKLEVGESVVAIGNALGAYENTVSSGVISGLGRSVTASGSNGSSERLTNVIQTDTAINQGNSGGPLLNLHGDVVGINVARADNSSNIGFALPINSVKSVISQVKKTGKISRPYVGIRFVPIDSKLQSLLGLKTNYGLLIQKAETYPAVVPNSPADIAGIKEGDIILEIDGKKVDLEIDFINYIRQKKIGDIIKVKVLSNDIEKTLSIKLAQAPEGL